MVDKSAGMTDRMKMEEDNLEIKTGPNLDDFPQPVGLAIVPLLPQSEFH